MLRQAGDVALGRRALPLEDRKMSYAAFIDDQSRSTPQEGPKIGNANHEQRRAETQHKQGA